MKKEDFVKVFAEELGTTQKDAEVKLDAFTSSLLRVFKQGEGLTIRGFGAFEIVTRKARKGHNPNTGEEMIIPEKKTVKFKPGKLIKDIVK